MWNCATEEIITDKGSINAISENKNSEANWSVWTKGDMIWIHTTTGSICGKLESGEATSNGVFSYESFAGKMNGTALYPFNAKHTIKDNVMEFILPPAYDLGESINKTNAAMYGVIEGKTVKFRQLAGVIGFVLNNVPAGTNRLCVTFNSRINGVFKADLTAETPTINTEKTQNASEMMTTLNFDALKENSDITLYVPIPVGSYTKIDMELKAGNESLWSSSIKDNIDVERHSQILLLAKSDDYIDEYGVNHGKGVEIDGTTWAPVNCGYHDSYFPFGKLYQWGRKYGQGYSGKLYDKDGDEYASYTDSTSTTISAGGISVAVGNDPGNKDIFYTGNSQNYNNWTSQSKENLWNSGTEEKPVKTEYDPCPAGWRVPTLTELNGLKRNSSGWISNKSGHCGYYLSGSETYSDNAHNIFMTAAGWISYGNGKALYRANEGNYWSSKTDGNYACFLYFDSSRTIKTNGSTARAAGFTVRCVKDL
jgi:uncharacterized protein (TIGR02145 family)